MSLSLLIFSDQKIYTLLITVNNLKLIFLYDQSQSGDCVSSDDRRLGQLISILKLGHLRISNFIEIVYIEISYMNHDMHTKKRYYGHIFEK